MNLKRHQVAVVMLTDQYCFRELMRGIGVFAKAKATWKVQYYSPKEDFVGMIRRQQPDGVILSNLGGAHWLPANIGEVFAKIGNVVGLCGGIAGYGIPIRGEVTIDDRQAGAFAADHFLQKKFTNFAYIRPEWGNPTLRLEGFQARLQEFGYEPAELPPDVQLSSFLLSLPKPLAVFAWNDIGGRKTVEVCKEAGLRVPEDVSVLGVDNDPLDCELCHPALSSVALPWERIGFLAASQLDQVLDGQSIPEWTYISPVGIAERRSTDSIAISDPDVATSLIYIREHAHIPFSVDDILDSVPAGRRTLEKRFKSVLGRTLLDEIRRVRVDRAKDLLAQSDLPVSEVAARCGFSDVTWFSTSFHRLTGSSPLQYRRAFRK